MRKRTPINLTDEARDQLEAMSRSRTLEGRRVQRAKVVLLAAEGLTNRVIGARLAHRKVQHDSLDAELARSRLELAAAIVTTFSTITSQPILTAHAHPSGNSPMSFGVTSWVP